MTNRESLLRRMGAMDDEALAAFLEEDIAEGIALQICRRCQRQHRGACPAEDGGQGRCPRSLADWLREEAG